MNDSILGKCWNCGERSGWSVYCPHCGANKLIDKTVIIIDDDDGQSTNDCNFVDK
jgi:uncharacterized protein (DUF983 family)